MWIDKENLFSAVAGDSPTASAISTNVIDTSTTLRDLGNGAVPLYLVIVCTAAAATATSVAFSLESDSTANLATSATVHASTGAIAIASLTLNSVTAVLPLPMGNYERYLGVRYTVAGSNLTAGTWDVFLTTTPQKWLSYATGTRL